MTKDLVILGSTGSIGRQTLDVAQYLPIRIRALAAGTNVNTLNTRLRRAKGLLQAELKGWYFDEED